MPPASIAALQVTAVPAAQLAQGAAQAAPTPSPEDVARLRALVAESANLPAGPSAPTGTPQAPQVGQVGENELRSLGDSILQGLSRFNSGYAESIESIGHRLDRISSMGPTQVGENFADVLALQMDVARWSMSVMGVDNASKAGTNTVKELSRGG